MKKVSTIVALLLLPSQVLLAQNEFEYKKTASASGVKKGTVTLDVSAGVLEVKADATTSLVETQVQYSKADWLPVFSSNNSKTAPEISFSQKEMSDNSSKNTKNEWKVNLSKNTLLDLKIKMGAGETKLNLQDSHINTLTLDAGAVSSNIDLRGSKLKNLTVNAGVGELNLDLRGNWDHDVEVDVTGGIGDVKFRLPKNTGVRLKSSGLGSRNMASLQKEGDTYVNAALGKSKHVININVSGGLGSVTVLQDE
ncbi:toast rack family protein [Pontibacter toksunensis]|uniref:Toast rack family protein n=1 Tax=Pontibacter toksunensis TaxID=1332631 RepID=A0ABW6BV69_9BACT